MSKLNRDPELDRLVRQLNDAGGSAEGDATGSEGLFEAGRFGPVEGFEGIGELELIPGAEAADDSADRESDLDPAGDPLDRLLAEAMRRGASDVLLVPGSPPSIRVDGKLETLPAPVLLPDGVGSLLAPHLGARHERALREHGAVDLTLRRGQPGGAGWRFRVNLHRQRGVLAAALRALPRRVPTLAELGLPASLAELVAGTRGLVLVCGPTGSGKSTTVAALVGHLNRTRAAHVVTIEDPVEYEHESERCLVEQVEVGGDAPSFAAALRAALRQDPDVIVVGEMRDLETVAIALTAAETGHLVLATLHTHDVVQAVHRIVDVFPADQQAQIRQQLSISLHALVAQQLVPRADRAGRVPAVEILTGTFAVRNHIRNQQPHRLHNEVTLGKRHGMVSLEDSLARLVRAGVVAEEEARIRSSRPEELESLLRVGGGGV